MFSEFMQGQEAGVILNMSENQHFFTFCISLFRDEIWKILVLLLIDSVPLQRHGLMGEVVREGPFVL